MFDIFFGWRKASKCKKLIKRVQCRLKLLKNKRYTIVKQLREDLAQLIKLGYEESAFNRAEQLFKDESIMAVYDMLDNFCEFVNIQLSYIRRNKDCPNDINEAVSSLIFASARCADLPELPAIRKLFGERYGQRFATTAVELLPGNLVNREIKEKLSIKSVSDDVKYRLIDEIARDYGQQPEILALEFIPEMQQQLKEISRHQELDTNNSNCEGSQMQTSDATEIEGKFIQVDPLAMSDGRLIRQSQSYSYPNSDAICTSLNSSKQPSPDKMESPVQIKAEKVENFPQTDSPFELTVDTTGVGKSQRMSWICTTTLKHRDERKAPSSSESLPQLPEEAVVYLDDIEELQSSTKKGDCQDQRLFKFKSPLLPKRGPVTDGYDVCDESYVDNDGPQDEKSSSRTFSKRRNSYEKRSRRRSLSLERSSMKDSDHETYYEKPCKTSPSHKHKSNHYRKLQKKTTIAECEQSAYVLKRLKQPCCKYNTMTSCCNCRFNSEVNICGQEYPFYFFTGDDREEEFPPRNQKRGLRNSGQFPICDTEENLDNQFCHCQCSCIGGCKNETGCTKMEEMTLKQNLRRRSYDNSASVYEVFTLPKMEKEKTLGKTKGCASPGSHVSSNSSLPSVVSSQTRKETVPPYLRAMTMPQERPRDGRRYSILRSNSLSFQNPNHVHPKLPDYDDLAAKFMALKKERLL
ncbi:hypothetical protein SCA6_007053 [Theobroma cacao]